MSLKNIFTLLFICSLAIKSFCQPPNIFSTTQALKDSIQTEYLTNKAEKISYFSPLYQAYLDSAIAITPDNDELWREKGMPYFKCRKYEVGLQYEDIAVQLNPKKNLDYRAFLKCIFCKTYKDAIVDFINAEKLNGNFTTMEHPYSFYIGISYLQLNQFDSAENYLNKTIETEKAQDGEGTIHFMDWFYLGIVNYEKKNYQQAIDYFDKALSRYNNFSEAEYYKYLSLKLLNAPKDEIVKVFSKAKDDFEKGYSFTEDNCVYEKYPYQLSGYMVGLKLKPE
jgi:tetratricopeptide (TPR) repeat protein